ncbi:hypothetical protein V2J09_024122 [Rumex salicifolius]
MEGTLAPADKESMISSFLEIAVGQTADTARQFLQATSWKLEEAIQLFYVGNEGGLATSSSSFPPAENIAPMDDQNSSAPEKDIRNDNAGLGIGDEVRPPLPVIREALYDDAMMYGASRIGLPPRGSSSVVPFRNFEEEMKRPGVWEADQGSSSSLEKPQDNLAALYRPPFDLMFQGSFEKAKVAAASDNKWLLVNLQSTTEFSSHMLNRDTWANEAVAQTIKSNFIFWQVYDDSSEGKKVCTYYKVERAPVVLVIDAITGQKMRLWTGMIHPDRLLEDLLPYMEAGPHNHHVSLSHKRPREPSPAPAQKMPDAPVVSNDEDEELQRAIAASMEGKIVDDKSASDEKAAAIADNEADAVLPKRHSYPPLPEEPKADKTLLCRVGFRLPDGRRVQRNFLRTDPIQLLWSFCYSQLQNEKERAIRLAQAIPGSSKTVDFDSELTLGDSGLSNSMILGDEKAEYIDHGRNVKPLDYHDVVGDRLGIDRKACGLAIGDELSAAEYDWYKVGTCAISSSVYSTSKSKRNAPQHIPSFQKQSIRCWVNVKH